MIAITPQELAERRKRPPQPQPQVMKFVKPCKHCGSTTKPKAPGVNVCRDCRAEQKRRNRIALGQRKPTMIGG